MSNPQEGISEGLESVRRRLTGTDLSDSDVRSLQLHMEALNRWARISDPKMAGHDHDHMDDHDHAMMSPVSLVASNPEAAQLANVPQPKTP